MATEKNAIIEYNGSQITLFSDEKNDYVNLTDMAAAWKNKRPLLSWLRNKQTLDFLSVWETKYNPAYRSAQLSTAYSLAKNKTLSTKQWIELTGAIGIFTKIGDNAGTYAHRDIAIRFAGYLSPEFELHLVEEIQRLKKIEEQKHSYELLTHDQVLSLVRLKEVFKYVAHQQMIEDAHKEVFASKSSAKNPFAEFNTWRNKILDISPSVIDERIKQYCLENKIALTKRILNKSKRDKILMLDTYESVRNSVWDFLQIKGEVNALNLANLVGDMIRTEKGEILLENKTDLFHTKQELGIFTDFQKSIAEMPEIKTARQLIEWKKKKQETLSEKTDFNQTLMGILAVPPPKKGKEGK